ncbi:MAG: glycerol dehydrogenase [Bacteroidales bacterium]
MSTSLLKAVFPGKYIQGERALKELTGFIELLGHKALILASPTVKRKVLPEYQIIDIAGKQKAEVFSGECCEKEISRLEKIVIEGNYDVCVAIGGGKVIDTMKIVADKTAKPVIIAPTIASTDAPCSGCAVVYSEEGVFEKVYYQKLNPQIVLVDTSVITHAPARFLVAGMGDALATWFEARSCDRTQSPNECGGYSTLSGLALAELCYHTLLKYGKAAKTANERNIITPALNHIIEANTLLSGIGFESSGIAAAHSIHNGLTALVETHPFYHGEKVAFGLLASLHLTDAEVDETETVYSFCEEIGLPTTFADIGIIEISRDKLMQVAVKACAPAEGIHKEAGDITPERVTDAMIAADAMGKSRKF